MTAAEEFAKYGPRGKPRWPDWRKAKPGTRVRVVATGRTGTFVKPSTNKHNGAIVDFDDTGFGIQRGYVVAAAYELEPITDLEGEVAPA